ncbi:MAG: hypothetical protein ACRDNS_19470 [Trebonia sp.]
MHDQSNATRAGAAPSDPVIRTRRALEVCVICGHEHVHGHRRQVSCPECATAADYPPHPVHDQQEIDR